jgi:hypothetical protein
MSTPLHMAVIHRPSDVGIDLPPGSSADDLTPADYRPVEMVEETIQRAAIHRPGNLVVELPAGLCAADLLTRDFRVVEIDAS